MNKSVTTNSNSLSTQPKGKNSLEKVTDLVNTAWQASETAKETVSTVTTKINEHDIAFIRENQPYIDETDDKLLMTAFERNQLTAVETVEERRKHRRENLEHRERVSRMNDNRKKATGQAICLAGIGVGIGTAGAALLIRSIRNRNNKS